MASLGIPEKLVSYETGGHVPFAQYGDQMEKQSTKFIYTNMDLIDAQGAG
jgi:hypothetical protein